MKHPDYQKFLRDSTARREKIQRMVMSGKPRSVVARIMGISRQRVYQLTDYMVVLPRGRK